MNMNVSILKKYSKNYLLMMDYYLKRKEDIDLLFIKKYKQAYGSLSAIDKTIIDNEYLSSTPKDRYKFYSKSTYYRRRNSATKKFLEKFLS